MKPDNVLQFPAKTVWIPVEVDASIPMRELVNALGKSGLTVATAPGRFRIHRIPHFIRQEEPRHERR